ncbi:patatin-like phospholipase family protein [Dyadobacter sp. CY326]|uniref:patatin-like phospholipase family protein n=1 Tax=Dyadobacter sp. CY326 TaxID=2907300 RepID=UPI001F425E6A|nr:patatin-like phospholipase family protein [Dyadobacter sp. CY326]MCE7065502.1 patatin-like phospholipase family protein [Dyadobacter sp. CY326]
MKVGLVLSGGGARGIAHIGAVKALMEARIKPDIISGTSSGAFIGAMLAHGYLPDEIMEMIAQTRFYPYFRLGFGVTGLLQMNRLEAVLWKYIPENTFESLKTPLVVTVTDIVSGEELQFRSGELAIPVLASCCIPGLFSPILFQGHELVDGGVLNNLPVEPIMNEADFLIGVHCNPFTLAKPLKRTTEIIYRSLILAMHSKTKERFKQCNLLIEPPELNRFGIFDFRKADQLFNVGYVYTKRLLEELEMNSKSLT